MNLPGYIAKRYILAKKSHNAINIVSIISMAGVVVGTIAFILILSVFNGFDQLVRSMYNSYYSDIQVLPAEGKVFETSDDFIAKISDIEGVEVVSEILEDYALLVYNSRQTVCRIKGVSENYRQVNNIEDIIWKGKFELKYGSMPRAIVGRGIAYLLGVDIDANAMEYLKVFVPKRTAGITNDPNKALNRKNIKPSGIFSSQPDIDGKYTIIPLETARQLFDYQDMVSSLEVKLKDANDYKVTKKLLEETLGEKFIVRDRYMQNELLYKTMRTEKWAIFLILALVLIILLFSLVGSISMLIIEKKKDISILYSLGADRNLIRKIFYREGILITLAGLSSGLLLGSIISFLQQQYGLVKLHGGFMIDAYPVDIQWFDLLVVAITVFLIGAFSSWYPVRFLLNRNFNQLDRA